MKIEKATIENELHDFAAWLFGDIDKDVQRTIVDDYLRLKEIID